jgi:hypothetical protein
MALRALAEAMTGTIHFVLWSKPTQVGQFWFFSCLQSPTARIALPAPVDSHCSTVPSAALARSVGGRAGDRSPYSDFC